MTRTSGRRPRVLPRLATGAVLALPACRDPGAAQPPDFGEVTGQATCKVTRSSDKPLIVEWAAPDREELERRANLGLVAVRYEACELEILPNCKVRGEYEYAATSPKHDVAVIRNADDLYATLPVGAARLEAKLEIYESLGITMDIVGSKRAAKDRFTGQDLVGGCENATHVINAITVGAFEFFGSAGITGSATAEAAGVIVGASSEHKREILARDGNAMACDTSSPNSNSPPDGCSALIRIAVAPIERDPGAVVTHEPEPSTEPTELVRVRGGETAIRIGIGKDPIAIQKPIKTFEIERTPVSVAQYAACVEGGACSVPSAGGMCTWKWNNGSYPVNCVTKVQASEYCEWIGRRLPSPAEWWMAAFEGNSSIHGNETAHESVAVSFSNDNYSPVGTDDKGEGVYGIRDVRNNGDEWLNGECRSIAKKWKYYYEGCSVKVVKQCNAEVLSNQVAMLYATRPDDTSGVGFRCAKSLSQ